MPMIVLGLLSVCQLTFLPGLLVGRVAKLDAVSNRVSTWFGLSLVANYLVVLALTVMHAYSRPVVLALFVAEVLALIVLLRGRWLRPIGGPRPTGFGSSLPSRAARALALLTVVFTIAVYAPKFGEIFHEWDAVVSWDHWAVDWAHGVLPRFTYHYPQLVPANWSLTYHFIGTTDVKFFAHWFMGAFEAAIPLALLMAGSRGQRAGYYLASALAAWLMWHLGSRASGYVDTAVACLALLAVLSAFESATATDPTARVRSLEVGAVLAAGAAVTKQAGLWIALFYPVMAIALRPRAAGPITWRQIAAIVSIEAAIVLPWYVYKEIAIHAGADFSEVGAITGAVHHGRSPAARVRFGLGLLGDALRLGPVPGTLLLTLIGLAMAYACREREGRWLALLVTPFFAGWLLLWSYDLRNLALALPLAALAAGLGTWRLGADLVRARGARASPAAANRTPRAAQAQQRWWTLTPFHLVLFACAGVALLWPWSDARLERESLEQQRQLGDPVLDGMLYGFDSAHGFDGKVLTDYQYLGALPEIGRVYALGYSGQPSFLEQSERPEIGYVLYCTDWASPQVRAHFARLIERGQARRVLGCGCWEMVTTCRGPCDVASRVDAR